MNPITLNQQEDLSLSGLIESEWLETNGLGGFASSSISGIHTRRYHGWLSVSKKPPLERYMIVSKLAESLHRSNEAIIEFDANQFPDTINPEGFQYLKSFKKGLYPSFTYESKGFSFSREILMCHGKNTTIVRYKILDCMDGDVFCLQPFLSLRQIHHFYRAHGTPVTEMVTESPIELKLREGPDSLRIQADGFSMHWVNEWFLNYHFEIEKNRGYDFEEDQFYLGELKRTIHTGDEFYIVLSCDTEPIDPLSEFEKEINRRKALLPSQKTESIPAYLLQQLVLSADQFIVQRDSSLKTIIAGYHWFGDWGRDTMISLPGLCLATGRNHEALEILKTFGEYLSEGMIPNRFPEANDVPEYNNVDGTLWFIIAMYKYYTATGDEESVKSFFQPIVQEVVEWHRKGTRYNIKVDEEDGLLNSGVEGQQLTWMDAKVNGWVVTPRYGKPVEINALWYNVLRINIEFLKVSEAKQPTESLEVECKMVQENFAQKYFQSETGYLNDLIDEQGVDSTLRPNQCIAFSLPFEIVDQKTARSSLDHVREFLLTPNGLRTLDPRSAQYRKKYEGDLFLRDSGYHQGASWTWLIGPYLTGIIRNNGEEGRHEAIEIITKFGSELRRAGIGTISELFDGDTPHAARGCISQAWSVAELLRVCSEDLGINLKATAP